MKGLVSCTCPWLIGKFILYAAVSVAALVILLATPFFAMSFDELARGFPELGDGLLHFSIFNYNSAQILATGLPTFDFPIFQPFEHALLLTEPFFGQAYVIAGLRLLGAEPLLAVNLLYLATPVANALVFLLVCRALALPLWASLIGATAILLAPFPLQVPSHAHVTFFAPILLCLLAVYLVVVEKRTMPLPVVGSLMGVIFYFGASLIIMGAVTSVVFLLSLYALNPKQAPVALRDLPRVAGLGAVGLAGGVLFVIPYLAARSEAEAIPHLVRSAVDVEQYSFGIFDPVAHISSRLGIQTPVPLEWVSSNAHFLEQYGTASFLILPLGILAVIVLGIRPAHGRLFWALVGAATLCAAASLGPFVKIGDRVTEIALPYLLLLWVPGPDLLRVAARYLIIGNACTVLAATLLLAGMARGHLRPQSVRIGSVVAVVGLLLWSGIYVPTWHATIVDDWRDLSAASAYLSATQVPEPVFELPAGTFREFTYMLGIAADGKARVNGVSSNIPAHYLTLLREAAGCPSEHCLTALTARGVATLVVHLDALDTATREAWKAYLARHPDAQLHSTKDFFVIALSRRVGM